MKKKLSRSEKHRYTRIAWDVKNRPTIVEFLESDRLDRKVTGLDEVVLGEWFHLERMSNESWYLRIDKRAWDIRKQINHPAVVVELE